MKAAIGAAFLCVVLVLAGELANLPLKRAVIHAMSHSTPPPCTGFSGTFSSFPVHIGLHTHPQSIAVSDFNHDMYDDLAVADRSTETAGGLVSVLLNNTHGNFTVSCPYPSGGNHAVFVVAQDFDGIDGPDIAVANQGAQNTVGILLNNGDGTFPLSMPNTLPTGCQAHGIAYGEFGSSGLPDLAVANIGLPMCDIQGMVQVFLNARGGDFTAKDPIPAGDQPHAVSAADFNGDGTLDLLVANGGSSDTQVTLLKGLGMGTFTMPDCPTRCFTTGKKPVNLAVGNFNGDEKQDFASADLRDTSGGATVGFNNGMGGFTLQANLHTGNTGCTPGSGTEFTSDVAVGDINHDGIQELVVTNFCQNTVTIYSYDSSINKFCDVPNMMPTGNGPRSVALFHLHEGDTNLAIAVANDIDNTITIYTLN